MFKTRLFDVFGVLSVTCWLGILTTFAYQQLNPEEIPKSSSFAHAKIAITEGNTWLVLTRESEEVGYIQESRTRVDDHWLFEYEMMMIVEIGAMQQVIDTHTRATLNEDGVLEKFQGDITSFMGTFFAKGAVEDGSISIELDIAGKTTTRSVPIDEPPRLSNTAINELVAQPDKLVVGKRYEQEFFDPMQQQMSNLSYVYIEHKEIDLYETKHMAYHFEQELMGDRFDVYVSAEGEILIQEFPMRTIASRLPEELGKSRVSSIKRQLKQNARKKPDDDRAKQADSLKKQADEAITPHELGLTGSLKSLSNLLTGKKNDAPSTPPQDPEDSTDMSTQDASPDLGHSPENATP